MKSKRVTLFTAFFLAVLAFVFFLNKNNDPILEEMDIVKQVIREDLNDSRPFECMNFHSTPAFETVIYEIQLLFDTCGENLIGSQDSAPRIPNIRIDYLEGTTVSVEGLDGEYNVVRVIE